MRKLLIFETNTGNGGHHIEYVHHLYMKAASMPDSKFYFVVSDKIKKNNQDYSWPKADNIIMEYVPDDYVTKIKNKSFFSIGYYNSKLLRSYIKKYEANEVILTSLMVFMPFLPFFLPKGTKCYGIIYIIYLYLWKSSSIFKKIINIAIYKLLVFAPNINRIFILNDTSATIYLNKIFRTNKFEYLPDPIVTYEWKEIDIRNRYKIPECSTIFLQCGIMSSRKYTLEIVDTIKYISNTNIYFVFAGKVSEEIKKEFYENIEGIQKKNIVVIDEFLSYDLMYSLLKASDYVLALYRQTALSSGFIGHAARFNKPVVVRKEGLIGKIVKKYHLGHIVSSLDSLILSQELESILSKYYKTDNGYLTSHTIESFSNIILKLEN